MARVANGIRAFGAGELLFEEFSSGGARKEARVFANAFAVAISTQGKSEGNRAFRSSNKNLCCP